MDGLSECRKKCWLIASIAGILALIVLWLLVGFGLLLSLFWALVLGLVLGFLLPSFLCGEDSAARAVTPEAVQGVGDATDDEAAIDPRPVAADENDARVSYGEEADSAEAAQQETVVDEAEAARRAAEPEVAGFAEAPASAPYRASEVGADGDFDQGDFGDTATEGTRPPGLSAARGGVADDLKRIKGVGPKLERVLNEYGFFHFDQIAAWSAGEVAWVDANLGGITERVKRDGWVDQARLLAAGGETEFSQRVDRGDVY
ncbi:MAG: hypothetical protein OEN23_00155 [Paracoccaceae bacterium]|nr:hypothetical protein [Paracoccaceae bacterium]